MVLFQTVFKFLISFNLQLSSASILLISYYLGEAVRRFISLYRLLKVFVKASLLFRLSSLLN